MTGEPESIKSGSLGRRLLPLVLAVTILVVGAAFFTSLSVAPSGNAVDTYTQFTISAGGIVTAAAGQSPSGYTLESSEASAQSSGDWAVLGQADGSTANITALVFASPNDSRAYFGRLVSSLKGLPGYADATSALSAYNKYGGCYGYGEDVDGIAVVNGVCTKGNVFLQVHLVSTKSLEELEADMTSLMGALCDSVG